MSPRRTALLIDLAPALALGLLGVAELAMAGVPLAAGTRTQHLFAVVVACLALVARRRQPVTVVLAVAGTVVATTLGGEPPDEVAMLLAIVVAVFSVATYRSWWVAALGCAATASALVVAILRDPSDDPSNLAPSLALFVVLPAVLGGVYRRRRLAMAALADRAQVLEATRDAAATAAVEAERLRIARELHDVVSHAVTVIAVQAEAGGRLVESDASSAHGAFMAIADASRSALVELGRLLRILRDQPGTEASPTAVDEQVDLSQLPALIGRVRDSGLTIDASIDGDTAGVDHDVSLCAYRVVQEALTNVLKHSDGTNVTIEVRVDGDAVTIVVGDDGSAQLGRGGHGLTGLWERVAMCGGTLTLDVRKGFAVRAWLPVRASVAARP